MTVPSIAPAPTRRRDSLPGRALFGLFLSGFIGILTECLPAGLLPELSATLGTDVALTGQVVTIYALATALAAIPLSRLTARWPRKNVLQLALGEKPLMATTPPNHPPDRRPTNKRDHPAQPRARPSRGIKGQGCDGPLNRHHTRQPL
jgi:hypothetical protein